MGKSMKKTFAREQREKREKYILLVKAALETGCTTRRDICKAANMKTWELTVLFNDEPEIYALYKVRRITLVDTAADNLQTIVEDLNHPQNFAATKFVLQKYKSDLDQILTRDDAVEISVDVDGLGANGPVVIKFGGNEED